MYNTTIPIPDSEYTVTRLAVKSVVDDLIALTQLESIDQIIFRERKGVTHTYSNGVLKPGDPNIRLSTGNYLIVDYTEKADYDRNTLRPDQQRNTLLFKHAPLGVYLWTINGRSQVEMDITLRSQSYDVLNQWIWNLQRRRAMVEPTYYHTIQYNYRIPDSVIAYLYDVWALSEKVEGYNLSLKAFNDKHYTQGLIFRTSQNGERREAAINTNQNLVLGIMESVPDEISVNNDEGHNEISFSYRFNYDRPNHLHLTYQKFIHGQSVSKVYEAAFNIQPLNRTSIERGTGNASNQMFRLARDIEYRRFMPEDAFKDYGDRFLPPNRYPNMTTLLSIPIRIPNNPPDNLINLTTLSQGVNEPWISVFVALARLFPGEVLRHNRFPFHLEVYRENAGTYSLEMRQDGDNFILLPTISVRDRHYLVISFNSSVENYEHVFFTLAKHKALLLELARMMQPSVGIVGEEYDGEPMVRLDYIKGTDVVEYGGIKDVIQSIKETNRLHSEGTGRHSIFISTRNHYRDL